MSKIELVKILLHSIKACLILNWTLNIKINSGYIRITPILLQKVLRQNAKVVVILQPNSRLHLANLIELNEMSGEIKSPTVLITDLIYLHDEKKLSFVHLPNNSPELIKQFDYTKEIGIYICFENWKDCVKVNLSEKSSKEINIIKLSLPLKTIKKDHPFSDSAEVLTNHNDYMKYELVENIVKEKISVVIPSAIQYMVATKFYDSTSSFSRVIEQIANHLSSLGIEFEIIAIVGPEVNKENLTKALSSKTKFVYITDDKSFNFSRRVNLGLQAAQYDLIWLINDDIKIIDDSSTLQDLRIAIELANRKSTGFVGTFLLDSKKLINHAGIKIYGEIADHYLRGTSYHDKQAMNLFKVREVLGVTGANLFFSKNHIKKLGLWNENYPNNFNDLEMCLRAREQGLQNYVIRTNNFIHFESKTRNAKIIETDKLLTILDQYRVKANEDLYKFTVPNCCL
jgi:GT2 family glycosyltransferase